MCDSMVSRSALDAWLEDAWLEDAKESTASPPRADMVSLSDYVSTIERIAEEKNCLSLGWQIGESLSLLNLGEFTTAVLEATTLRSALKRMCDYFELLQDSSELRLHEYDDDCSLEYRILDPNIWPRHQDAIFTLAIKSRIIRNLTDIPTDQIEIILETDDQKAADDLEQLTGVRCVTGGEVNAIRFPKSILDQVIQRQDPPKKDVVRDLSAMLVEKRRSEPTADKVRQLIYRDLGMSAINQAFIARELGLSCRTLRRQLAAQGSSFQGIVDDCRMRQAKHEIKRGRAAPITQLALRLGYSEHSTFCRAFMRWNGVAPLAYLRNHQDMNAVR